MSGNQHNDWSDYLPESIKDRLDINNDGDVNHEDAFYRRHLENLGESLKEGSGTKFANKVTDYIDDPENITRPIKGVLSFLDNIADALNNIL